MGKPVLFRVANNLNIGGIQRRLRALLPLLTSDFEVHIVTYKDKGVFFEELKNFGVQTHFLPRRGHWSPHAIYALSRLFRQKKADIVHTHSFGGNIFGLLAAKISSVPVRIGNVHLTTLHWYGKTKLRRQKQCLEEHIIHRICTHKILFVSEESRKNFQKYTRLPSEMLYVLHNGIEFPEYSQQKIPCLDLPQGKQIIGFAGRLTRGKGFSFFLEQAEAAYRQNPEKYHFLVAGDGDRLPTYKEWVSARALDSVFTFLGERRDMDACYKAMDCLLFCSEPGVEGMSGVLLEACAHGLPVLARPSVSVQEVSAYYTRLRVWEQKASITEQLDAVMDLPVADLSALRQEFSLEAMRTKTVALYQGLLSAQKGGTDIAGVLNP